MHTAIYYKGLLKVNKSVGFVFHMCFIAITYEKTNTKENSSNFRPYAAFKIKTSTACSKQT